MWIWTGYCTIRPTVRPPSQNQGPFLSNMCAFCVRLYSLLRLVECRRYTVRNAHRSTAFLRQHQGWDADESKPSCHIDETSCFISQFLIISFHLINLMPRISIFVRVQEYGGRALVTNAFMMHVPRVGPGHPSFSLVHLLPHLFPLLLFPFFHWLYLFSSFVHPFPFYQNSPTPFPGRRS